MRLFLLQNSFKFAHFHVYNLTGLLIVSCYLLPKSSRIRPIWLKGSCCCREGQTLLQRQHWRESTGRLTSRISHKVSVFVSIVSTHIPYKGAGKDYIYAYLYRWACSAQIATNMPKVCIFHIDRFSVEIYIATLWNVFLYQMQRSMLASLSCRC